MRILIGFCLAAAALTGCQVKVGGEPPSAGADQAPRRQPVPPPVVPDADDCRHDQSCAEPLSNFRLDDLNYVIANTDAASVQFGGQLGEEAAPGDWALASALVARGLRAAKHRDFVTSEKIVADERFEKLVHGIFPAGQVRAFRHVNINDLLNEITQ